MIIYAFLIFFIGFVLMILLGRAFRKSRKTSADHVADQKLELEQIIARHNAAKLKQDDSKAEQK